jgi:hypothetical protein
MPRKARQIVVRFAPLKSNTPVVHPWKRWVSFTLGTGLAISESLPFVDNQYNGIIHAVKQIREEIDKTD